jgi:hypothetical protein
VRSPPGVGPKARAPVWRNDEPAERAVGRLKEGRSLRWTERIPTVSISRDRRSSGKKQPCKRLVASPFETGKPCLNRARGCSPVCWPLLPSPAGLKRVRRCRGGGRGGPLVSPASIERTMPEGGTFRTPRFSERSCSRLPRGLAHCRLRDRCEWPRARSGRRRSGARHIQRGKPRRRCRARRRCSG